MHSRPRLGGGLGGGLAGSSPDTCLIRFSSSRTRDVIALVADDHLPGEMNRRQPRQFPLRLTEFLIPLTGTRIISDLVNAKTNRGPAVGVSWRNERFCRSGTWNRSTACRRGR